MDVLSIFDPNRHLSFLILLIFNFSIYGLPADIHVIPLLYAGCLT